MRRPSLRIVATVSSARAVSPANDARVPLRVLRNGWFLQPYQVEWLKRSGGADRLID